MLSIGEFSKICMMHNQNAPALRQRIGLLKPVHYNRDTGYRYYEVVNNLFRYAPYPETEKIWLYTRRNRKTSSNQNQKDCLNPALDEKYMRRKPIRSKS